ncbi:MAG: prepilin-type N-terminal cleavage/methylation domain-containing protein [Planctomycetota bacterium]
MKTRTVPAAPRAREGFTLIEVLLAMGVLLVGVSMLLGILTFGAALSRAAMLRGKASATVEAVVQDLEENLFTLLDDGTAGAPRPIVERPVPGVKNVMYSAKAEPILTSDAVEVGGELLYREYVVDVDVRWTSGGVERAKMWRTVLLREVPFGERMRRRFIETPPPTAPPSVNQGP